MNNSPIANRLGNTVSLTRSWQNRTRKVPNKVFAAILGFSVFLFGIQISRAGSATWNSTPATSDWNTATNWTPTTIPNGLADLATFSSSTNTSVSLSSNTQVDEIIFSPNASAFTVNVNSRLGLTISGTGVTNNSGIAQNFVTVADGGEIVFTNNAAAGNGVFTNNGSIDSNKPAGGSIFFNDASSASNGTFTNNGGGDILVFGGSIFFNDTSTAGHGTFTNNGAWGAHGVGSGVTQFHGNSTAGNSTFTNNGGQAGLAAPGGYTQFFNSSSASNGSFTLNSGATYATSGGQAQFFDNSSADNGTFIINGGVGAYIYGGWVQFFDSSSAENATFTINGGAASGAGSGATQFNGNSSAGNAILTANGGSGNFGGLILFYDNSAGGTVRVKLFGNGALDINPHNAPGMIIGSVEGSGNVFLGNNNLSVGNNNLSTTFSGIVQGGDHFGDTSKDTGSLTKIGTGTLTLSGNNVYTGGTNISGGRFLINNTSGSGTGSGPVAVDDGVTLGGSGTIQLGASASLTNNGTIAPGSSVGQFNINGAVQLSYSSNLSFEIGGTTPATQYDVLNKTDAGALTLKGKLTVTLINGFTPQPSDTFTVVTTQTTLGGTFTNVKSGVRMNTADGAGSFEVTYNGLNNVVLSNFGPTLSPSQSQNISTRANVQTGDGVTIGGFIINGSDAKKVIVRGVGPSLQIFGIQNPMPDPTLELHGPSGVIASNDNWKDTQQTEIQNTGLAPGDDLESAIVATLQPGTYSVILRGQNNGTGIGLIEVFDIDPAANSKLANISTRGLVGTDDNVMIGGIIVGPNNGNSRTVLVRAIGPSLQPFGIQDFLADPTLELHDAQGNLFAFNDNWKDTQQVDITTTGLSPSNDAESAILVTLATGNWTAIVRGAGGSSGVALIEVYDLQ